MLINGTQHYHLEEFKSQPATPCENRRPPPASRRRKTRVTILYALASFVTTGLLVCVLSYSVAAQSAVLMTPPDEPLEANPNRPSSSNSADILAPGVLQLEYGWTREWDSLGVNGNNFGGELRYGLLDRVEVRWGGGTFDTQFDGIQTHRGFGDQYLASQLVLRKETPRVPTLAFGYAIKFPFASAQNGLGTGRVDHTFVVLASKTIHKFTLDFNAVTQILGRQGSSGFDKNNIAILAVSHAIFGPLGGIVEFSGVTRLNSMSPAFATNLWALTYQLRKRLVLDCAFDVGLTPGAPRMRALIGFTYAFGKFGHGQTLQER